MSTLIATTAVASDGTWSVSVPTLPMGGIQVVAIEEGLSSSAINLFVDGFLVGTSTVNYQIYGTAALSLSQPQVLASTMYVNQQVYGRPILISSLRAFPEYSGIDYEELDGIDIDGGVRTPLIYLQTDTDGQFGQFGPVVGWQANWAHNCWVHAENRVSIAPHEANRSMRAKYDRRRKTS